MRAIDFQPSPFAPLSEHMAKVKECVSLVEPMFQCVCDHDPERLKTLTEHVFKAEHQADIIKNEIRRTMPKTFNLPIYRGDLLAYLKLQDDMADTVEDIAVVLSIKANILPPQLREPVLAFARKACDVCDYLFQCTDQLIDLKEADLLGPRARGILDLVAKAEHAEFEADKMQFALARALFALDDELKATDIFLWSEAFQELGKLANAADKTAERIRRMISH